MPEASRRRRPTDVRAQQIFDRVEREAEGALFRLLHLFGDTVQWNTRPEARDLGTRGPTHPDGLVV